jgi:hypothetical protein
MIQTEERLNDALKESTLAAPVAKNDWSIQPSMQTAA